MAPARRHGMCTSRASQRQSAADAVCAVRSAHCNSQACLCPAVDRRRRLCWSVQPQYDCVVLPRPDRRRYPPASAAAVHRADVQTQRAAAPDCTTTPCSSVRRSNSGGKVKQRHVMTSLYCAVLVDKLAVQLSQLDLQTDTLDDDTKSPSSSSSSRTADGGEEGPAERRASVLTEKQSSSQLPSRDCSPSTSSRSNSECSRRTADRQTSLHDTSPLCTARQPHQTTSMLELLRRSCRIPRPVASSLTRL